MRFEGFQVTNYRNILDSGWIGASQITAFVGQNEAGKSNLFEALYCINPFVEAEYDVSEDWPVDRWGERKDAEGTQVCVARFSLTSEEISALYEHAKKEVAPAEGETPARHARLVVEETVTVEASRGYGEDAYFEIKGFADEVLDEDRADEWVLENLPKFVLIQDYEMSGAQVELDALRQRLAEHGNQRHKLSNEDQTILIILDLAEIDLDDFFAQGQSAEGRTNRSFDKRSASQYLSSQFSSLWRQKNVKFDIEIDGPTLNIFATDDAVGMPVRLHRRSTGFRWYVSFAWKFTHATNGDFEDCILLLEEPGIHLHFSGQRDLLSVFERLSEHNVILYTTHLASMVDLANPERVRIVESRDNHLALTQGVVSTQREPMAVIEQSLGLTGDQSGLLSNRQVLIVEGGDDALILYKLSGVMAAAAKESLSSRIYLWAAHGASKTPMYAAFSIGQGWDAGVLLDSDPAGIAAQTKINDLYVSKLADAQKARFRTFMLGQTVKSSGVDFAIEDLFPESFYLECVNAAFGVAIKPDDLPVDGSTMICKRVETVLQSRHGHIELDKRRVMTEMLRRFDTWKTASDLPTGTAAKAEKLFKALNKAFSEEVAAKP